MSPCHAASRRGALALGATILLVARGNNGRGMSGVMWVAGLHLIEMAFDPGYARDMSVPTLPDRMMNHLYRAGMFGASVINLSQNAPWDEYRNGGARPVRGNPAVERNIRMYRRIVSEALRRLDAKDKHPLVVVSAGNYALDAAFGGTTLAKLDYPGQVIVVGAATRDLTWWAAPNTDRAGSNKGTLVDVVAPGAEVYALAEKDEQPVPTFGTSVAAPFVAGAAGLLKSFDPALTAPRLKQLIIAGAEASGRTLDGIPALDAYEALKAAARRAGAPLCGNRVWIAGGQLLAERAPGQPHEPIAVVSDSAIEPTVHHGGRRVGYRESAYSQDLRRVDWEDHAWKAPVVVADDVAGWQLPTAADAAASRYGWSHGRDSLVFAGASENGEYEAMWGIPARTTQLFVQIEGAYTSDMGPRRTVDIPMGPGLGTFCVEETSDGCSYVQQDLQPALERVAATTAAWSPRGDSVLLAVSWVRATTAMHSMTRAEYRGGNPIDITYRARAYSWRSDRVDVYMAAVGGSDAPTLVASIPQATAAIASISESGDEVNLSLQELNYVSIEGARIAYQGEYSTTIAVDRCWLEYRGGAALSDVRRSILVPPSTCSVSFAYRPDGTFAPLRAPAPVGKRRDRALPRRSSTRTR